MRSEKQIAASRLNGWKSSGATTSEGKARIVAAKFGVYAESQILPLEDPESPDRLEAGFTTPTAPLPRRPASSSVQPLGVKPVTRPWESP